MIETSGRIVGFVLANNEPPPGSGPLNTLAEFYISPGARRRHIGRNAARDVLRAHPGRWELFILPANRPAQAFWPTALADAGAAAVERSERRGLTVLGFTIPATAST